MIGEFLALREGLLLAKFHNFQVHVAEVDASLVVSSLNLLGIISGDASYIVNDIRSLFSKVGICKCQTIPKSGNALAHNLTSMSSFSIKERLWLDFSSFL
ncbi:hypothetical protein Ddye_001799 [Dipteronia dyeriana]|uniref:RNase H type-1 domain-containing protein n=1 Tax=Dipteronia dyeriana TaxID=168575 RepID=A0AAD9XPK7_9ROSI|nr:hypothetical protein Ddye_001799 [Dipteronia dyeriana]